MGTQPKSFCGNYIVLLPKPRCSLFCASPKSNTNNCHHIVVVAKDNTNTIKVLRKRSTPLPIFVALRPSECLSSFHYNAQLSIRSHIDRIFIQQYYGLSFSAQKHSTFLSRIQPQSEVIHDAPRQYLPREGCYTKALASVE